MIEIKTGAVLKAEGVRTGSGAKGEYFLCKVKAEKGKDTISVWNNDGFSCNEGDTIRVDEILSVKKSARKWQEKWFDTFDVVARLSYVGEGKPGYTVVEQDNDLPF